MGLCHSAPITIQPKSKFKLDVTIYLHNLGAKWNCEHNEIQYNNGSEIVFSDGDIYIDKKTDLCDEIIIHTNDYDTDYADEYITIYNIKDLTKINDICRFAIECCNKYLVKTANLNVNFYCLHMNADDDTTTNIVRKNYKKIEAYKISGKHIKIKTKFGKKFPARTLRNDPWIYYEKQYDINIFVASSVEELITSYNHILKKLF